MLVPCNKLLFAAVVFIGAVSWGGQHFEQQMEAEFEKLVAYSAAVNTALEEVIRVRKIQSIPRFFGTDIWGGDLSQMREDRPPRRRSRK